jgi:RHS repeat-associated protein
MSFDDGHVATDYLRLGGKTIARLKTVSGSTTVSYLHQDHLGSPAAATDGTGAKLWRENYTPYGEERVDDPANDNDESFTGHIKDDATGLTYMQARYFDPVIGRFLSGDPVGFSVGAPQQFNRYSYALNDPINNTDPTGMFCIPCIGGTIGAVTGAVANTAAQFQRNGGSFDNFSVGELGAATVAGAAFGATAGAAGAIGGAVGATSAAVIAGTGAITLEAINSQELTVDGVKDALVGEAMGKGAGKAFKMLDDVPTEVTEAGVSAGQSAVTAVTPADEPVEIEEPQREEDQ